MVLEWITENRASLARPDRGRQHQRPRPAAWARSAASLETVTATDLAGRDPIAADIDCTVEPATEPADDVDGFLAGYIVIAPVGPAPTGAERRAQSRKLLNCRGMPKSRP